MSLPQHQLSAESLAALARGGGGATAVGQLAAAQHSKHVLLVWGVMHTARAAGHPQAEAARSGYQLLGEIQRRAPAAVEAVLRYPAVGGWARRTLRGLRSAPGTAPGDRGPALSGPPSRGGGDPGTATLAPGNAPARLTAGDGVAAGEPAQLAALAAAAAVLARHSCAIDVPVRSGRVTLPAVGQAALRPAAARGSRATVRVTAAGTRLTRGRQLVHIPAGADQDAPGWRSLRPLRAIAAGLPIRLVIDDLDPYRMPSAAGLGGRLSASEAARWQVLLAQAWDLLAGQHAGLAAEIQTALQVLTPLLPPSHGQLSASSREVFGCVALSPPADGLSLAVTLAHEVQHAKLAAILDLVPLTRPDDGRRYYAPWRDDPRPAAGLLHGAYAYLGVSGFWQRHRQHPTGTAGLRAHAEFARWREATTGVTEMLLASGSLTVAGETFAASMLSTLRGWADDDVPPAALRLARVGNARHRERWLVRNQGAAGTAAG